MNLHVKKELRSKKVEFGFKVFEADDLNERKRSVSEIMEKHHKVNENLNNHLKKEISTQENEFDKKMERRRERSVSRSMNKSVDRKASHYNEPKQSEDSQTTNFLDQLRLSEKKKSRAVDNPFKDDYLDIL